MSSSILSSQGMAMALATAMAALSGTVIVLSFCLHKSHPSVLTPSINSSVGKKKETEKKKKKVHFAEDVELRRKKGLVLCSSSSPATGAPPARLKVKKSHGGGSGGMPANRVALYNGILRDRLVQRMAYSL